MKARGTNDRDIDPHRKIDSAKQKFAYYHANMMPPPDAPGPVPVDREAALAAKDLLESPEQARRRALNGQGPPAYYVATPPVGGQGARAKVVRGPYQEE